MAGHVRRRPGVIHSISKYSRPHPMRFLSTTSAPTHLVGRTLGETWDEFCPQCAGMSKRTADRIIENLKEFGDSYFNLRDVLKIPAPEYRAIQPAVEDNTLEFEGRRIPIDRENTQQLIEAV